MIQKTLLQVLERRRVLSRGLRDGERQILGQLAHAQAVNASLPEDALFPCGQLLEGVAQALVSLRPDQDDKWVLPPHVQGRDPRQAVQTTDTGQFRSAAVSNEISSISTHPVRKAAETLIPLQLLKTQGESLICGIAIVCSAEQAGKVGDGGATQHGAVSMGVQAVPRLQAPG